MRHVSIAIFATLFVLAGSFWSGTANAQATRTWVSGVGDDVNPCSRTAPCKTFAGAISKTAAKGEINCLDPGGFGAVTITKSISIVCYHTMGGILAAGSNGIIINLPAATDRVTLEGLDIEGAGTGLDGVRMLGLGSVTVARCTIRGFTQEAVEVAGGTDARAMIVDSYLTNNNGGISIGAVGPNVNGANILNVVMDNNTAFALKVGSTSTVTLSESFLRGSVISISTVPGAAVISYGTNILRNGGLPTQTLPRQ